MTPITLSRFDRSNRAYSLVDSYRACLDSGAANCHSIQGYMDGLIRQLRNHADEPVGWTFATWSGGNNALGNFRDASAIMLEYALPKNDTDIVRRLHNKAQELGWAFILIDTETRSGNTVTIVFPLTQSIGAAQYGRLAAVLAQQIGEYGLESGSLAATHIVQVHGTTTPAVFEGTPLNPDDEIRRTADQFQKLDARRFEGNAPSRSLLAAKPTIPQPIEDGLFVWYETPAKPHR